MGVKVKICGLTNLPDALASVEAGADALGFVFYEGSPRFVSFATAAMIIKELPALTLKTGLFVNAPPEVVRRAIEECGLTLLQFHGDESPEYCAQFGVKTMKAFRVQDAHSLEPLPTYATDFWLLDAFSPDRRGGTGEKFDWELAVVARELGRPIFLAGGLTPGNVAEAIQRVRPYGVDVSSGVESTPRRKDHGLVKAFIAAARGAGFN
jgi:phosphoribosylanthranilate isomerase